MLTERNPAFDFSFDFFFSISRNEVRLSECDNGVLAVTSDVFQANVACYSTEEALYAETCENLGFFLCAFGLN